ncbi:MAG: dihydropteroate synthase [Nitrosopumilus sp. (ex Thoosa mismalolli)]|nr:dihydropteroate synthase [Nitrosopumilus sp. (ex Thoosa mismalolli)]
MTRIANISIGKSNQVRIMGILNASPESFYKKSIKTSKTMIKDAVTKIEDDGADFIDVGGMSTAPYLSTVVSEKIESTRILNAIKIIQDHSNLPISVDTCRSNVAKIALENNVEIINDISGLKYDNQMKNTISKYEPDLILCAFSNTTVKGNHVLKTKQLLEQSIKIAKESGISSKKLVVDPSIGFFRKTGKGPFFTKISSDWVVRDLSIIQNLKKIKGKFPILISVSNKSFIGSILKKDDPSDRLSGTIAAETISVLNGADIIRTHNVNSAKDAISIARYLSK